MDAIYVIAAAALLGLGLWAVARQAEVFVVRVENGRATTVRGRVPPGFMEDLRKITRGAPAGTIRALRQRGGARLDVSGLDEHTRQRLRNAFALNRASTRL